MFKGKTNASDAAAAQTFVNHSTHFPDIVCDRKGIIAYVSCSVVGACIARPRNYNTPCLYPRADISVRPYDVAAPVVLSFRPSEARGEIPLSLR